MSSKTLSLATFGGGCFWCTEAIFRQLKGVYQVVSGYSGGTAPGRPTYREVCSGLTGHAEVVQLAYNEQEISYKELLRIFMSTHDPTTLNRQGADTGTQYRSVIYYHDKNQQQAAREVIEEMAPYFSEPIVTEISPLGEFYEAEDYHQDYYRKNPGQGYCNVVISPKLAKFRKLYADKLKSGVS